ncbi:hypothetical protein ACHAW5_003334 [Stephanodiscus triporus]|uniref:Uncharacterized protein n=1 Tax=Stephanodiscus triporus TaxID=2934178 RepID=A0ABD3PJT4_9STRA
MDTFISGIIDCVARPSTTDSPVRVVRKSKSASESPTCVSVDTDLVSNQSAENLCAIESETETYPRTFLASPNSVRGGSSSLLSHFMVPDVMHNSSVLTAEGIIDCGDLNACYDMGDDYLPAKSSESIETSVVRQFESAFATFLYKNPAFSSMSYMTLQKLRAKLLKESAKNIKVENELRKQLSDLRDSKRERELELQRELLVVTRAKAAREADLRIRIEKTRRASMMIDNVKLANGDSPSSSYAASTCNSPKSESHAAYLSPSSPPAIAHSASFEELKKEMTKNKMEQAHILAEIEQIKMKIAEESVAGTFGYCSCSDLDST